jgi:peptidoglycan/xylan/chitin deacetylase (PgdA/CDA1 family)
LCLPACAVSPPGTIGSTPSTGAPTTLASTVPASPAPGATEDGFTASGDVPTVLDPELLNGIITSINSRSEIERHEFATWPQFDLPAVDQALATYYLGALRGFEHDYPAQEHTEAPPELNLGWHVVAASPSVVGVASDGYEFAGASGARSWHSFWFDPRAGTLLSTRDLVNDNVAAPALAAAAARRTGIDLGQAGSHPLDAAPLLAFSASGDLLVGFDQCQVAACAEGRVSVTVPQADGLLTTAGQAARAASLQPSAPTASTSPPTGTSSPNATPPPPKKVDCRKAKCIALTFDDGPGPYTQKLLGYLRAGQVPATFFMLGRQVETYPKVAAAVAAAGNEIGVHTWDHRDLTRLRPAQIDREIGSTVAIIKKVTGVSPRYLRPPYGAMNPNVHAAGRRAGLALVLWSVDTLDWKTRSTPATVSAAVKAARRGSIILVHDIHPTTVAAVPAIISQLKAKGYTFVTVSQILGKTKPGQKYFHG